MSYLCGASERHLVDIHVSCYGSSGRRSHTRQDIHNPFRKTNLETEAIKTCENLVVGLLTNTSVIFPNINLL